MQLLDSASLTELIWPKFNERGEDINLRFSSGKSFTIKPKERLIFPKQVEFFQSIYEYDAVLYGGSMASGKTYSLLWAAIKILTDMTQKGVKNPRVGVFSSTYPALNDRHMKELDNYFPDWLGRKIMKPPEYHLHPEYGGGQIMFRNLSNPADFKSVNYAAILIDEITEIPRETYNYLITRKRFSGVSFVPVLAATNPTGPGRQWVYEAFVDPEKSIKSVWVEKQKRWTKGHKFIKALPTDNPTLTPEYLWEMEQLPEHMRVPYFEGGWGVYEGMYFWMLDPMVHQFDQYNFAIPHHWPRYRAIDAAYGHPFVCLWMAVDPEDGTLYVYREYSASRGYTEYHKERIWEMSVYDDTGEPEEYVATVGDVFGGQKSSEHNKTAAEVLNDNIITERNKVPSLKVTRAVKRKKGETLGDMANAFGFERVTEYFDGQPIYHMVKKPRIMISSACHYLWKSLVNRTHDKVDATKIQKTKGYYGPGEGDDETDALEYGYKRAVRGMISTIDSQEENWEFHTRDRQYEDPPWMNPEQELRMNLETFWAQ